MSLANELISAIIQLFLLTLIPFVFFIFRKNKKETFFEFIGFYKPTMRSFYYLISVSFLILIAGLCLVLIDNQVKDAALSPITIASKVKSAGFSITGILILLINTIIKTSLSEEIFFRGFLGKRLIKKFGFQTGNLIQSTIFGLVHCVLFALLITINILPLILIFIFTGLAGWIIGYYKEKKSNGSIIPGWIAHAFGNTIATFILAYFI